MEVKGVDVQMTTDMISQPPRIVNFDVVGA